uniref:Uncharacterized protein n=1 Tax=Romanomermis culicivorax TaxID=13658 RepID=A0A915L0G7_ROMCU
MFLVNKPGSLIARRLCRNLSVATIVTINGNLSPNSTLFNIPEENTSDVENVFQKDDVEIQFSNKMNSVDIAQWHTFDENMPTPSKKSLPSIVYFVTRVSPCSYTDRAARYLIEDKCVPVAWKTDDSVLKVLFSSTPEEFADLLYDWKDHLLTYRHYFDIVEFKISIPASKYHSSEKT